MRANKHFYPAAKADREPSPWWYFGRAVYVSRRDYKNIFYWFVAVGFLLGILWVVTGIGALFIALMFLIGLGFTMLFYSLFGLYRMYGHPSETYFRQLLALGAIQDGGRIADLHIGTYRHSFALSRMLPLTEIISVDCWKADGPSPELAVQDVRDLEPPPAVLGKKIEARAARDFLLPIEGHSCDAVVFGFGTHEIPEDGSREKLFNEAKRVLKKNGKLLLFEHGIDPHNFIIFGPVIHHVTTRAQWEEFLKRNFKNVRYECSPIAVDLFAAEP